MSRVVAAVSSTRADFGLQRWIFQAILASSDLELRLIVSGTHLSREHGFTVDEVVASGLPIADLVDILSAADGESGTVAAIGRAVDGIGASFERLRPDAVLLLGDRHEIFGAGAAATALRLPIFHLCGGETTAGAVDQVWRNSLTKMAHRHLVATEDAAARVREMGEEECRIVVVGSPGLESFRNLQPASRAALLAELGLEDRGPLVLVTFHPVTNPLEGEPTTERQLEEVLGAIGSVPATYVVTAANADAGGSTVNQRLKEFADARPWVRLVANLGSLRYLGLMKAADAMLGNSSSGIIEAPSAGLPVVNVGSRQQGRLRAANVIDVAPAQAEITASLERALSSAFRDSLSGLVNPYGDGRTSVRVVDELRNTQLDRRLLTKL